jgi:hypothetical protein
MDGDGFGNKTMSITACPCPAGWVLGPDLNGSTGSASSGFDCDDTNGAVHPGQPAFFTSPYVTSSGGKSWDYDCDGMEKRQYWFSGGCLSVGPTCALTPGWIKDGTGIPHCGETKQYVVSCSPTGGGCAPENVAYVQGCR